MKKPKKAKAPPAPKWKEVGRRDIKYESISLDLLLEWIKQNVPEGTKNEDIRLDFEVGMTSDYYDDYLLDAEMVLMTKVQ